MTFTDDRVVPAGPPAARGVYFVRLQVDGRSITRRLVLVHD